jgi:hypothetical protein
MRWVLAGMGAKAGKAESLSLLVEVSDLPGSGWRQIDERTWRTGSGGSDEGWAARAQEMNSITAWRSFESKSDQRWIWAQVAPMASSEDAVAAVAAAPSKGLANLRRRGEVVESGEVESPVVPGAAAVCAHGSTVEFGDALMRSSIVAASIGAVVFVVAFTAGVDDPSWGDLDRVLAAQAARVADPSDP